MFSNPHDSWATPHPLSFPEMNTSAALHSAAALVHPALHAQLPVCFIKFDFEHKKTSIINTKQILSKKTTTESVRIKIIRQNYFFQIKFLALESYFFRLKF